MTMNNYAANYAMKVDTKWDICALCAVNYREYFYPAEYIVLTKKQ